MKIETLVEDIYKVLEHKTHVPDDVAESFGRNMANLLKSSIDKDPYEPKLRGSNIGTNCERELWYTVNTPEDKEKLQPNVHMKFLIGHVMEQVLLALAKIAGHKVEGEQDALEIGTITGHRDAIIDGVTVDAKSASTRSFAKFESGLTRNDDGFGYLDQLNAYVYAGQSDERVQDKGRGAFLVVDKTLGHICLDIHEYNGKDYAEVVSEKTAVLASSKPPPRGYFDEADGKAGNRKLGTVCSYC